MRPIDLKSLTQDIETFVHERDWDQFHSVKNLAMALSVESSELLEIFQWMREEDSNRVHQNEKLLEKIEDEVADVFIYLLRIISKTHLDLETCVRNKMDKNARKYPVDLSRGNTKKYTEL
jgi:NTP pyrophosphatase (non-canonical NTP hydrolase)